MAHMCTLTYMYMHMSVHTHTHTHTLAQMSTHTQTLSHTHTPHSQEALDHRAHMQFMVQLSDIQDPRKPVLVQQNKVRSVLPYQPTPLITTPFTSFYP